MLILLSDRVTVFRFNFARPNPKRQKKKVKSAGEKENLDSSGAVDAYFLHSLVSILN